MAPLKAFIIMLILIWGEENSNQLETKGTPTEYKSRIVFEKYPATWELQ